MRKIFLIGLACLPFFVSAQQFIDKAMVEYEVKTNVKKTMGNNSWDERMKENMATFKTGYYRLTFADNKSIYKFHHWEENLKIPEFLRKNDEDNNWYFDFTKGIFRMQKNIFGTAFTVDDSMPNIKWHLTNENRMIAGFNCRKAVGQILDSVYVFAFYTDEITFTGGPCSLNGLPGLILGVTIPRLYSSWIATKVQLVDVAVNDIKTDVPKKPFTRKTLENFLVERTKEWGDPSNPDSKKWMEQLYWNALL